MQIKSRLLPFRTGGFDVSDEKRIETNMDHELTDHPQGAPVRGLQFSSRPTGCRANEHKVTHRCRPQARQYGMRIWNCEEGFTEDEKLPHILCGGYNRETAPKWKAYRSLRSNGY